jgi:hypothetical protein
MNKEMTLNFAVYLGGFLVFLAPAISHLIIDYLEDNWSGWSPLNNIYLLLYICAIHALIFIAFTLALKRPAHRVNCFLAGIVPGSPLEIARLWGISWEFFCFQAFYPWRLPGKVLLVRNSNFRFAMAFAVPSRTVADGGFMGEEPQQRTSRRKPRLCCDRFKFHSCSRFHEKR